MLDVHAYRTHIWTYFGYSDGFLGHTNMTNHKRTKITQQSVNLASLDSKHINMNPIYWNSANIQPNKPKLNPTCWLRWNSYYRIPTCSPTHQPPCQPTRILHFRTYRSTSLQHYQYCKAGVEEADWVLFSLPQTAPSPRRCHCLLHSSVTTRPQLLLTPRLAKRY